MHVESRARDHARWLVRDHGDGAEAIITAKIESSRKGSADRYRYVLTRRELMKVRAAERRREGKGIAGLWHRLFRTTSRRGRRVS